MNALVLLLAVASTLVLRSGDRIAVDGPVREENGVMKFRSAGVLYSLPSGEVQRIETAEAAPSSPAVTAKAVPMKRLRVTEEERKQMVEKLQKNHSGTPAPRQTILENPPPAPSAAEVEQQRRDEWAWRRDARAHEEGVRRAQENLQLIENRIEELRTRVQSFIAQGFKPRDFTYDTSQLVREQEQLPYARLEVERAKRANDQFREDARRQGVLPGWLR